MKKFLSAFLVLVLLFTCVACGKSEPGNTDSTTTTESTTENATESTTRNETTTESVSEDESTTVVEESTTKAQSEEETTKKNNTTTTTKPKETTTKKAETTTKKPSANTTTTTKPTATEKKPYFVSFEVVSIQRAENYMVDGMHILDRVHGKNQCFQYGDIVKIRVNMSDGGNGFSVYEKDSCTVSVSGNIITAKITGSNGSNFFLQVKTTDKNGNNITPYCRYKIWVQQEITDSYVIKEYARAKGLTLLNGCDEEPYKRYVVEIPGNSNWMSEALASIDNARSLGCKRYTYQIVYQGAFAMSVYK